MISIIIPIYNSESFLDNCISSIVNQDYSLWELILINDGSTDNSLTICKKWCKKDKRIKVANQNNKGASAARNKGIELAEGEWIIFIDSDDYVLPNYLSDFIKATDNNYNNIILCIGGLQVHRSNLKAEKIQFAENTYNANDFQALFKKIKLHKYGFSVSKLYNRFLINKYSLRFEENVHIAEDCIFMMNYIINASKEKSSYISFIKQCNYIYMIKENSLSTSVKSYEEETYSYNIYKNTLLKLKQSYNIDDTIFKQIFSTSFYLDRIINSIYLLSNKKERINKLKMINIEEYRNYKKCNTKVEKILFFLLINKIWFIYDLLRKHCIK